MIFAVALGAATFLSADVVAADAPDADEQLQLQSTAVQLGALVMVILRASVGFVFFLIAMVLKAQDAGLATFGARGERGSNRQLRRQLRVAAPAGSPQ